MTGACVLDAKAVLGEGPLWDPAAAPTTGSTSRAARFHRFDPRTGRDDEWQTPADVGSLALRAGGGLVVALKSGFQFSDSVTR